MVGAKVNSTFKKIEWTNHRSTSGKRRCNSGCKVKNENQRDFKVPSNDVLQMKNIPIINIVMPVWFSSTNSKPATFSCNGDQGKFPPNSRNNVSSSEFPNLRTSCFEAGENVAGPI